MKFDTTINVGGVVATIALLLSLFSVWRDIEQRLTRVETALQYKQNIVERVDQ